MATPKQVNFIRNLQAERGLPQMPPEVIERMPSKAASELIGTLLAQPKVAVFAKAETAVPVIDGYYAVEYLGTLRFYRLKHGKPGGRWEHTQFVNRYAGDNLMRPDQTERATVRSAIADDVEAARLRFARELGRCYVCGRTLTDEKSRRLGIGPDCRGER